MAKPADISTKRLISLAPNNWVKWVTQIPDVVAGEILNSEFQWISRESDVLIRAESKEYGQFMVLNELQLRYKAEMPRRMRAYTGLAEEKYKLPTYPVLINILKTGDAEIPTRFESNLAGLQVRQDYRVINLWEVDVKIALEKPLASLLPFVPILKGGEDESIIREALRLLQADEQLNQLETVLAFFATFVLDSSLVQEIMRWDMTVLRESPWYEEILQQGMQQGIQQGMQQGEQQGERKDRLSSIELCLEVKFGNQGLKFMRKISEISDLETLKIVQRSILTVDRLEELRLVMDNL